VALLLLLLVLIAYPLWVVVKGLVRSLGVEVPVEVVEAAAHCSNSRDSCGDSGGGGAGCGMAAARDADGALVCAAVG
jgi:hypothetical protein